MKWIVWVCVSIPGVALAQSPPPQLAPEQQSSSELSQPEDLSDPSPTTAESEPPPTSVEEGAEPPPTSVEEGSEPPPTTAEEVSEPLTTAVPPDSLSEPRGLVGIDNRMELEAAIQKLVAGDYAAARQTIDEMVANLGPDHWMMGSLEQLRLLVDQVEDRAEALKHTPARDEESVASLYTTMTLFGLYTGIWLFGIVAEADLRVGVPLSVVTAGVGLGGAYLLDHRDQPLTGPVADGISAGLLLGAAEAGLAVLAFEGVDGKGASSAIWGASAVGGIVGGYAADASGASRGDVSLATSAYGWGAVLGLTIAGVADASADNGYPKLALAGATAGLGAGILAATHYEMSTSRVLYMNLGGLAGSLVGLGLAVGGEADGKITALLLGGLYFVGLGVATHLTRDLDDPEPGSLTWQTTPTLIAPVAPGQQPAAGLAFRLRW